MLGSKRTLFAITHQCVTLGTNKVPHIITLGLLYALVTITNLFDYLAKGQFCHSGSHM